MGADDKHVLLFAILEKENYKEGKGYSYKTCIYIKLGIGNQYVIMVDIILLPQVEYKLTEAIVVSKILL